MASSWFFILPLLTVCLRFSVFLYVYSHWNFSTLCFAPRTQCDILVEAADVFPRVSFRVRDRLRQLEVHVSTLEAWKIRTWLAYPYFPVWHFLNNVPVIVPVLNRYDLIISSIMRQSLCNCAIPYSRPTNRPSPHPSPRSSVSPVVWFSINPYSLTC